MAQQQQHEGIQVTLGKPATEQIPFIPPTIHPFSSVKELERVIQSDPYNELSFQYKKDEIDMKEGIDYMSLNEQVRNFEGGSMNYYHVQAKMLSGVAHLDNNPNVYDVSCKNVNDLLSEIVVDFADFDSTARKMIPGTRLIVGKGWNCYNSHTRLVYGDEIAKYFLVRKRERILSDGKMVRIKFFTKPISFTQL